MSFDITIVGAGMVGQSLALALAESDLSIALIDPSLGQHELVPETNPTPALNDIDAKVSALTAETQQQLIRLGVWQHIKSTQRCAYDKMIVWDADGTGAVNFSAADVHVPELGHIIENKITNAALYAALKDKANITQLAWKMSSVSSLDADGWLTVHGQDIASADALTLSTRLLVGADGAQSMTRGWAGVKVREWDYHHTAIVATVRNQDPHQNTAWQRFRPEGPLAFLPLAYDPHLTSIVWSTERNEAQQAMEADNETFCRLLSEAFEHRLGPVQACSQRFAVPLYQRHATDYHADGIVLVGDSAHSIHPLAGQGVNLGFKDSAVLAEELLRAHSKRLPLNSPSVLQRYQRRRQADNLATMAAMEGFKRLFENDNPILRWARNQGMRWFDSLPAVKNHVILQAMGLNHKS